MRAAVIDLGTNTFHLLIAEIESGHISHLYAEEIPVKLGKGGINQGLILKEPYKLGIETIKTFQKKSEEWHVDVLKATATSAIRSASNGKKFIDDVRNECGIEIEVISGSDEAELIWRGVRQAIPFKDECVLIMDIGGGSVEFIIADAASVFWKRSFDIGAARLIEKFHVEDPMTDQSVSDLEAYLEKNLAELIKAAKSFNLQTFIGSAGPFETFTELIGYRFNNPSALNTPLSCRFVLDEFEILSEELIRSTLKQRLGMKGLVHMRADTIVVSAIMARYVVRRLKLSNMLYSAYALKEGLLDELSEQL